MDEKNIRTLMYGLNILNIHDINMFAFYEYVMNNESFNLKTRIENCPPSIG